MSDVCQVSAQLRPNIFSNDQNLSAAYKCGVSDPILLDFMLSYRILRFADTITVQMGFGFNLFFVFFLLPFTVVGLIAWLFTNRKLLIIAIAVTWLGITVLMLLAALVQLLMSKTVLAKEDYNGHYVINRDYFPGKQADWQYNTFRFEIKHNDSIYFYVTDEKKIVKTYRGSVNMMAPYQSKRLKIMMDTPTHHVVDDNPTTYRSIWSFYLVFNSQKFGNMFFKKGDWKPLKKK